MEDLIPELRGNTEIGKWFNNLPAYKQSVIIKLSRERLQRRYADSDIYEKQCAKWTNTEVVVSFLQQSNDPLTNEMLIDYYVKANYIWPNCPEDNVESRKEDKSSSVHD